MSELLFRPITELAELVRSGEVSSRELVEESLGRIDEVDGEINAFTFTDPDGALAAADAVASGDERPFAGVPIAIKDLGMAVAGWPLTNCCPAASHTGATALQSRSRRSAKRRRAREAAGSTTALGP